MLLLITQVSRDGAEIFQSSFKYSNDNRSVIVWSYLSCFFYTSFHCVLGCPDELYLSLVSFPSQVYLVVVVPS